MNYTILSKPELLVINNYIITPDASALFQSYSLAPNIFSAPLPEDGYFES